MMHSVYSTSDRNQNSETNDLRKEINSPYFLALQGSYTSLEIALFKEEQLIHYEKTEDKKASAELIPLIDAVLKKHSVNLSTISFIAADQGPGAFTSLRVTISTLNGLSFASGIPLIGVDGLDALAHEIVPKEQKPLYIVTLLNAFNGELFYGIYSLHSKGLTCIEKGYNKIETVISQISTHAPEMNIACAGNGITFCSDLLKSTFGNRITLLETPLIASAKQIGIEGLHHWKEGKDLTTYMLPLYLKTQVFKPKYS